MNYSIRCVTAKYDAKENAVREDRVKEFTPQEWDEAEKWLNEMTKAKTPAYFYMDGMQDTDAFPFLFCPENVYYKKEYKKVID